MKKYLILIPVLMLLFGTNLWATPIMSGTETVGNGGLFATKLWYTNNATLEWSVEYSGGHWVYNYVFNTNSEDRSQISHLIIEVSDNFTRADMLTGTTQLGTTYPLLDFYSAGPANPGLPETIYGIKWQDPETANASTWTITIVTDRDPMEGIFYAVDGKGGSPTYAYSTNPILVPDTKMAKVPEPITLVLFGLGFAGAGLYRKIRKPEKKCVR